PKQDTCLGPWPVGDPRRQRPQPAAQRRTGTSGSQEFPPVEAPLHYSLPLTVHLLQWFNENSLVIIRAQASSRPAESTEPERCTWLRNSRCSSAVGCRDRIVRNKSTATSSADRPGFAKRAVRSAAFRPANCPEFI